MNDKIPPNDSKLIDAAIEIQQIPARDAGRIGFTTR